ncbi:MAG: NADP-dependent phosphogluconate dehydrogenase [Deltaproteobacteria bacterium]|nr:NADP-dependent phosphogluconate dehydrogenase [Deltaproteobacteria bacterium]
MSNKGCDLGLVGLGAMGRNLVLNLADHGVAVAVYNRTPARTREFMDREAGDRDIRAGYTPAEFVGHLQQPRAVIIMVAAGEPVDAVIDELLPLLTSRDLLIDGGNSYFKDTDRRGRALAAKGLLYLGLGISGGEQGARHGPSLMPGGPREAYDRVRPILDAVAAKVQGEPCVAYLGGGAAGHYVKMVHNGIEYAVMELLAESYDLLRRGLGLNPGEVAGIFEEWNRGELASYLVEITGPILRRLDEKTGEPLIDLILDQARQKGTGKWTSQEAMDLQVPTPCIDTAVMMRDLSGFKAERDAASGVLEGPAPVFPGDRQAFVGQLGRGLYAGMALAFAQGLALLRQASQAYDYGLELAEVARIWRGGCIIRAALLEDIWAAFRADPELPNLLLAPHLGWEVMARMPDLRAVVRAAGDLGIPAPGLMVSLAYYDAFRSARLPSNLIQAQRDYFGAHGFERTDLPGAFHTKWTND